MDFLNQFPNPTIAKDDNSLFSFTDKAEQKGDLPFAFGTQSSEAGEISFLNQMKSQDPGESFALDNSQKNMGGLNFLKTIYEVPESSNNIFNSEGEFPLQSVPMGLDFIREGNEDNLNFDSFQNKNNSGDGGEIINVDINNLFKHSASPPSNNNSKPESKNENNQKKNKNVTIELSGKKGDNANNNVNNNKNIIDTNDNMNFNININKIPSFPQNMNNQNNQNKNINITPESRSNPIINSRQAKPTNNVPIKLLNNNNIFNGDNINSGIPESNNIIPQQFQNVAIKPQMLKEQKNNLDDIDKMISMNLQSKPENKQPNKNMINTNSIPNEISDIFSSSSIIGKRSNLEPKDKDLQNIDNLLNFTKEPMPSYPSLINKPKPLIMSNPSINTNNNMNNNNNNNAQFIKKKTQGSNTIMIKPLPSDSLDKKSQVIKLTKNDMTNLSQMDTSNKDNVNKDKTAVPSKYDMIQKYNDLANRLNKIREQAKEYRNLGNYFSQLISANENYKFVYPNVIRKLLEEYSEMSEILLRFVKIKNNKMHEMNNEFDEEVKKYSLTFPEQI